MGAREWLGLSPSSKANQLGIVYPAPAGQGYVDLPVFSPTANHWTTAWSGQVPVLDPGESLELYARKLSSVDPAAIYKTQPSVRKVVDWIARNVASTSIKVYNRVSDDERRTVGSGPLAELLRTPAPYVVPYRLWTNVLTDWLVHDRWLLWKVPDDSAAGMRLVRIPPRRFRFVGDSLDQLTSIRILTDRQDDPWRDFDPAEFVFDYGYSPDGPGGLSPMATLADLLAEQAEAVKWRRQVWANGARASGWIERPLEAMELEGWGPKAKARFLADFEGKFKGDGPDAGGTPLLEDGMTYKQSGQFNATDMGDVQMRQLSDAEVAAAFHVPPELVGARESTYGNVQAFRQMKYGDVLGPYYQAPKQALNLMLVPQFAGRRRLYCDWDLDSKLRGSFEERAAVMSAAVGAPWMTRNEARSIDNRPPVEGGDELVTPLNVLIGSQPSPQAPTGDGGDDDAGNPPPEPEARSRRVKSLIPETTRDRLLFEFEAELRSYGNRQRAAVSSALGAKAVPPLVDAWNGDRWDRELAAVLARHMQRAGELRASLVAAQLDTTPDADELARTLSRRAGGIAQGVNAHTYGALAAAVAAEDWKAAVAAVFDALLGRAGHLAATTTTETVSIAAVDAARDAGPVLKRWVVRSRSPRKSHALLSGETVPLDAVFSNGAKYPGAGTLPAAERANCSCDVELVREDS